MHMDKLIKVALTVFTGSIVFTMIILLLLMVVADLMGANFIETLRHFIQLGGIYE